MRKRNLNPLALSSKSARRRVRLVHTVLFGASLIGLSACPGGDPTALGNVQVFIEAEETIPDGLEPGTGDENIVDGWAVAYTAFHVVFGGFRAARSDDDGDTLSDDKVVAVDMRALPAGGLVVSSFDDVSAARFDRVGFDLPRADADTARDDGLAEADFARLVDNGWSLYVAGTITNTDGTSCLPTDPTDCVDVASVSFAWGVDAATSYDGCAPSEGDSGFAVPTGGTVQVKPTIHGDHWFFNNITQGAEITERRAQWVVDSDLDRDGIVTLDELDNVNASDVFPAALGYNLTGAIVPINTARDFFESQARTLGDFQGEGECPERAVLD